MPSRKKPTSQPETQEAPRGRGRPPKTSEPAGEPKKQFSVYLSQNDLKKLRLLASVQDTDVAALVNKAVKLLLEKDAETLERALKILDPLSAKD